jgi:hypothetical protein
MPFLTINLIKNANLKIFLMAKLDEFARKAPFFSQAGAGLPACSKMGNRGLESSINLIGQKRQGY